MDGRILIYQQGLLGIYIEVVREYVKKHGQRHKEYANAMSIDVQEDLGLEVSFMEYEYANTYVKHINIETDGNLYYEPDGFCERLFTPTPSDLYILGKVCERIGELEENC